MGCVSSNCQRVVDYSSIETQNETNVPVMRLCAPGKDSNFVDVGDTVVLYVDFGPECRPCQLHDVEDAVDNLARQRATAAALMAGSSTDGAQQRYHHEVMIAGKIAELTCLHPALKDSKCYKAKVTVPKKQRQGILVDGARIPLRLPYCTTASPHQQAIKQDDIEEQYAVYFQSIWNELKNHNSKSFNERSLSNRPALMGRYGSMGRTSPAATLVDQLDGNSQALSPGEEEQVRDEVQRRREKTQPTRYWPDSWQMRCWKKAGCDGLLRSKNPVARFFAMFFVTPLTNVTGLSLHYQLYLSEIFHTRFWTRLFHYLCMPLVVLMMLAFFAQWRFVIHVDNTSNHGSSCYKNDVEVLILNGTMVLGLALWVWYLIWGALQQTTLMGIFMIVPLFILYVLANFFFQVSVKNSNSFDCDTCWLHTSYADGHIQYYNIFHIMAWYYNPVLWVWVFAFIQSLSHIWEPKLPPRVSQTPHWLSCGQMVKRSGFSKTLCILSVQAIFGTVDEFLASPRLLPIFVLRVCYEIGYHEKQWKWMKKLVKKCQQYGDPALDFIGTGGSEYLSEHSVLSKENIDVLKEEVQSMSLALTDQQKELLESPSLLKDYKQTGTIDPFLEHFIILRHYVAQYALQVYAYGPFRLQGDEHQVQCDDRRMLNDFGDNESFMNFLHQVRFSLWQLEDDLIERRSGLPCCKSIEETV